MSTDYVALGLDNVAAIGEAIHDARRAANMTQQQLGDRAGVSKAWVVRLERAQTPAIELGRLLLVMRALGLSFDMRRSTREESVDPAVLAARAIEEQ
jgi:HTH-type transcriptional regulator / antitoxin HipB